MRCENCLQVLKSKEMYIVIQEDPQGTLILNCGNCGHIEERGIKDIGKQKALNFEGKSVYER